MKDDLTVRLFGAREENATSVMRMPSLMMWRGVKLGRGVCRAGRGGGRGGGGQRRAGRRFSDDEQYVDVGDFFFFFFFTWSHVLDYWRTQGRKWRDEIFSV